MVWTCESAYRARDKDLMRALARDLEQKDPGAAEPPGRRTTALWHRA